VNQVLALATKFKLDPVKCLDLCDRVPVRPECAIQIYKCCSLDAAAAACMLGVGGPFMLDSSAAAGCADSCCIEFESIFDCVGDEPDGATPSAAALAKADCFHSQANYAFSGAS
jgi:hypothetical protein